MAQLKSTVVDGDLSVKVNDSTINPKISVGGTSSSFPGHLLKISNESASSDGQTSGIELVCKKYLSSGTTASVIWGMNSSMVPCLYPSSGSGECQLGSSTNQWARTFSDEFRSYKGYTVSSANDINVGNSLQIVSEANPTWSSGSYGSISSIIQLKANTYKKPSADGSVTTYASSLEISSDGGESGDTLVLTMPASGRASSSSHSTNTLVLRSVGDSKSSNRYWGNSAINFELNMYNGSTKYVTGIKFYNTSTGMVFAPAVLPTDSASSLGTQSYHWNHVYTNSINTTHLRHISGSGTSSSIKVDNNLIPDTVSDSASTGYTLGNSAYKWRYLYAFSGTIQTSDRSAKDSIHYIESDNSGVMKPATMSLKSTSVEDTSTNANSSQITIEDVIDFVSNLSPVTFCYKDGQGEDVEATEENSDPEDIQLGLIADDIKDHKLFKYVGVETTYEEEITPAVKDEEGNVVTEAVTETKTTLGLQAIPLATAALTACKYLIQKNEEIELRLAIIEGQLSELLNQQV